MAIPLYKALLEHREKNPISLHVPGHKYGHILQSQQMSEFRDIFKFDVTELSGLDDLHSPTGVIKEAEDLLKGLYHTQRSFFLVNGSTVGNLAMIMASIQEGDTVLVQRNCHKSILNGLQLVGAQIVFIGPEYHHEWLVAGGVSLQLVEEGLKEFPDAKALIVTHPNYYGMVNSLADIIDAAHNCGVPVLVDEAHGAHFIAGEAFPDSAVELGADVVVQSAHKTLPALTMGAYLHVNSRFISHETVAHYLHILQSSSPSYPIMASLDYARSYLATYTNEDMNDLLNELNQFKRKLLDNHFIKVLDYDGRGDPLKLTLQTRNELNGFEMQAAFEREGLYTEMADTNNVLLILPLLKSGVHYPFDEIADAICRALKNVKQREVINEITIEKPSLSMPVLQKKELEAREIRTVDLNEAVGEIAAESVIPYPPGIPLVYPGELITSSTIQTIKHFLQIGAYFQSGEGLYHNKIKIVKN